MLEAWKWVGSREAKPSRRRSGSCVKRRNCKPSAREIRKNGDRNRTSIRAVCDATRCRPRLADSTKFLDFKKPIQLYDGTVKKGYSRFHMRSGEPIRSWCESGQCGVKDHDETKCAACHRCPFDLPISVQPSQRNFLRHRLR